jgi:hypothetical protein
MSDCNRQRMSNQQQIYLYRTLNRMPVLRYNVAR